jgi:hypothetical protein
MLDPSSQENPLTVIPAEHLNNVGSIRGAIDRANHFLTSYIPPIFPFDRSSRVALDKPSETAENLVQLCLEKGLRSIIVEQPVTWLNTDTNGDMFRQMFSTLITYLSRLGVALELIPTKKAETFTPRSVDTNQILFSYHTADDSESPIIQPNIWRIKESIIPPFFSFDRTGFSGWGELAMKQSMYFSSLSIDIGDANDYFGALRTYITENNVSKYAQPDSTEVLPENYVFHAMQIATDSVMRLAHLTPANLLEHLIQNAESTGKHLVVKRHPRCRNKETLALIESNKDHPLVTFSNGHIDQLVRNAESVVVINSGVGMESIMRGKAVFIAGISDYRWGAHEVDSEGIGLEYAFQLPRPKLDPISLAQFVTFYFRDYCMNANDERSIEEHVCKALLSWLNSNPESDTEKV